MEIENTLTKAKNSDKWIICKHNTVIHLLIFLNSYSLYLVYKNHWYQNNKNFKKVKKILAGNKRKNKKQSKNYKIISLRFQKRDKNKWYENLLSCRINKNTLIIVSHDCYNDKTFITIKWFIGIINRINNKKKNKI